MEKFKVVDIEFDWPAGQVADDVWTVIERELPERAWEDQAVSGGWREDGKMTLTFFDHGFEYRAGARRLLADLGATNVTETVAWI